MCMCICVCVYVYVYMCMCMSMCVCVCVCACAYEHVYACVCLLHACMYVNFTIYFFQTWREKPSHMLWEKNIHFSFPFHEKKLEYTSLYFLLSAFLFFLFYWKTSARKIVHTDDVARTSLRTHFDMVLLRSTHEPALHYTVATLAEALLSPKYVYIR